MPAAALTGAIAPNWNTTVSQIERPDALARTVGAAPRPHAGGA